MNQTGSTGPDLLSSRPMRNKTLLDMVKSRQAAPVGLSPQYVVQDAEESQRNYQIAANLRKIGHVFNIKRMRVVLPKDGNSPDDVKKAQEAREAEFYHQYSMPYYSNFMHTPTDAQRLNNPAMSSFMNQRQLTIPSSYGQFYAFMHALSAAFGNLQSGK